MMLPCALLIFLAVAPQAGSRLPDSALGEGIVETLEQVRVRIEKHASSTTSTHINKERNGAHGEWLIPQRTASGRSHSGEHHAINRWGDTRMGIGFPEAVHVRGAWFAGQAASGAWARNLQVIGYRAGREVGRSRVLAQLSTTPTWLAIDLERVERIVIATDAAIAGASWFALDDLTYESHDETASDPHVIDFDDLQWGAVLTGSNYAGLTWESGTGTFDEKLTAIHPPQIPEGAQLQESPNVETAGSSGPGTAPSLIRDFAGMRMFEPGQGTNYLPADTHGAIGPAYFVSTVNVKLGVFDRITGARVFDAPLAAFFGTEGLGDPRVIFDHHSQRFFLIVSSGSSTARIYFAMSLTSDPTGPWFKSFIETAIGTDVGRWPDYPTIGCDANGIYLAALMVPAPMTIWAIDKTPLLDSTPGFGAVTAWRDLPFEGAIQPCVTYGDSGGELLISRPNTTRLKLRQILGPLSAPTLVELPIVEVPPNGMPPAAPALGSATDIATLDGRLMNAVYRSGSVYTAHGIRVDFRAACRWYEIDVVTNTAVQIGTIADPIRHYYYPSVSVNADDHVALGFSGSHAGEYIGAWFTGHNAFDPPGATAEPVLYRAGASAYNYLDGLGYNRWGDYSQTSIDPLDDLGFWTIQGVAFTAGRWGTHIAELAFLEPCPAPWSSCFTSTNSVGAGSLMTSIGGTSLSSNNLILAAYDAPPGQFGLFFYGPQVSVTFLGDGALCIGGGISRLTPPSMTDVFGFLSRPLDLTVPPASGGPGHITAGSTWYFQFWYRDPAAGGSGFNFSDALGTTFCP